jgi:hypothetical protein
VPARAQVGREPRERVEVAGGRDAREKDLHGDLTIAEH